MQASGWSKLSEEAQSIICQDVGKSELVSVCLVSKTSWISSARRELYRAPLSYRMRLESLISLLRTLQSSPGIARFVRDLFYLDFHSARIPGDHSITDTEYNFFSMRRQPNKFAWMFAMVQACPRLERVSVSGTPDQLNKLKKNLQAISSSLLKLNVRFDGLTPSQTAVHDWIATLGVQQLEELNIDFDSNSKGCLENLSWSENFQSRNLLSVKRLGFLGVVNADRVIILFKTIPVLISTIISLHISNDKNHQSKHYDNLLAILRPQLRSLTLQSNPPYKPLEYYLKPKYSSSRLLSVAVFTHLPQIRTLRLNGFRNTIGRIELLQTSAPHLEEIDLQGSVWQRDSPQDSRVSQLRFTSLLEGFPALQSVHLGWCHISKPRIYRTLKTSMELKGVNFKYDRTQSS